MPSPLVRPYIPEGKVCKAIISGDASKEIQYSLRSRGIELILTEPNTSLPLPLARHADMQMVNVCQGVIVYAPGTSGSTLGSLKDLGFELIQGSTAVSDKYPFDIAYNCAVVGKKAFLNQKYSDPVLIEFLRKCNIDIFPVKQGYAKCSACILSEEAIITADPVIHKAAAAARLDALLIPPQKSIVLNGYDYGFIGGCTGLLSSDELAFLGDFNTLDSICQISDFCRKHRIRPVSLSNENIVDLGGVIPLCSV